MRRGVVLAGPWGGERQDPFDAVVERLIRERLTVGDARKMVKEDVSRRAVGRDRDGLEVAHLEHRCRRGLARKGSQGIHEEDHGVHTAFDDRGRDLEVSAERVRRHDLEVEAGIIHRARGVLRGHESETAGDAEVGMHESRELVLLRVVRDQRNRDFRPLG